MEAERAERERLVREEHDRVHQSEFLFSHLQSDVIMIVGMMKLIEERDRKLAERGIFTVEQEIAGEMIGGRRGE